MSNVENNLIQTETFTISYNSSDKNLQNHRLNAADLAVAIKEMHELLMKADRLLNTGRKQNFELFVEAPAVEGSLGIQFLVEMLNPENALAVLAAVGVVGTATKNLFEVAREMNGHTFIDVHTSDDTDEAIIELDGKHITSNDDVALLISHPQIRESLKKIVTVPLENHEQPEFKILSNNLANTTENVEQPKLLFNETDIKAIKQLNTDKKETEVHRVRANVTFTTISFNGTKGWRMILDGKEIAVEIEDERFLRKISQVDLSFKVGDEYKVELKKPYDLMEKQIKRKLVILLLRQRKFNFKDVKGWAL